ncbi:MAG: hypothetical protein GF390_03700 [Candidatus Pacebacteria bacterium]|nr:hypothetical protein [Candidatus Paceibacterota bacterium]
MIIDTHCHYNLAPLVDNWPAHWSKAQQHGVTKTIIPGSNFANSALAVKIAAKTANLYAAVGVHPHWYTQAAGTTYKQQQKLEQFLAKIKLELLQLKTICNKNQVVAIGEIGLDYHSLPARGKKRTWVIKAQKTAFITQLQLAQEQQLPVIIHARDHTDQAYWDVLTILKKHHHAQQALVFHCVSGPKQYLQAILKMNSYLGFAGNLTYPNAQKLQSILKNTPAQQILLETDAPYLAPQAYRGQTCEPWMITATHQLVTKLVISSQQLINNAHQAFQLK